MTQIALTCKRKRLDKGIILPNMVRKTLNDLYKDTNCKIKLNKIIVVKPILWDRDYVMNGRWVVDYSLKKLPGNSINNDALETLINKRINKFQEEVYQQEDKLVVDYVNSKDKPININTDLGKIEYQQIKNNSGQRIKEYFNGKLVNGVLDLTKVQQKDISIVKVKTKGIWRERSQTQSRGR